jgi:ketol-acid reductoisomerase
LNILFIEDDKTIINLCSLFFKRDNINFTHFDNMEEFINFLDNTENINKFSHIICDHNFPEFKNERAKGIGDEALLEIKSCGFKNKFIHFSSKPCPELYQPLIKNSNIEFESINKSSRDSIKLLINSLKKD